MKLKPNLEQVVRQADLTLIGEDHQYVQTNLEIVEVWGKLTQHLGLDM